MNGNAIPDKAREPAAKVSAGLKSGCGSYVTHVRPAIANSTVAGTKFRVINGGGEERQALVEYPSLLPLPGCDSFEIAELWLLLDFLKDKKNAD